MPSVHAAFRPSKAKLILFALFVFLTHPLTSYSSDARTCAKSIQALNTVWGEPRFPLAWKETSMSDGKPLLVSIQEKNDGIFLQFIKDKEGLWAESTGQVCQTDDGFEIEFTENGIRLGPAASWLLKLAIGKGGKFSLVKINSHQLRIKTSGWQGLFSSN